MEDEDSRAANKRLLILGAVGLLVAAAMLGLFFALISDTVVRVFPESSPTTQREPDRRSEPATETETPTESPSSPTETQPTRPPRPGPTLIATPQQTGVYDPIDLTGVFPGLPEGTPLQVERRENGAWVPFPVTLTSNAGGTFSTYVQTGRLGRNVFRITAVDSGLSTPRVSVLIE